jgi:hypothetical protein
VGVCGCVCVCVLVCVLCVCCVCARVVRCVCVCVCVFVFVFVFVCGCVCVFGLLGVMLRVSGVVFVFLYCTSCSHDIDCSHRCGVYFLFENLVLSSY